MTVDGWAAVIVKAANEAMSGDYSAVLGLAQQLAEEDQAKQLLRNAGIGYTGMSLVRTVQETIKRLQEAEV